MVDIYNLRQAYYYIQQGVLPVYVRYNEKTEFTYFVFTKEDTNSLYSDWLNKAAVIKDVTKSKE